jgi:hypothetical protein
VLQQRVPDERRFGEAVQEHQHRPAALAAGAATEGDAVRQVELEGLDHGGPSWVHCQSSSAVSPTPWRLRAENSLTSPPADCSLRDRQRLGGLAAIELVGLGQQDQELQALLDARPDHLEQDVVELGQPVARIAHQHDAAQVGTRVTR